MIMDNQQQSHIAKRYRKDSFLIVGITILGIVLAIIFASWMHVKSEKIELEKTRQTNQIALMEIKLNQRYHEENILQKEIDNRFTLRDQLMVEMARMRGIREIGQKYCKNGQYTGPNPVDYREKLYIAAFSLIGVSDSTYGVFHNPALEQKITQFVSSVYADTDPNSQSNLCGKNALSDDALKTLQTDINKMILASIAQLKQRKKSLGEVITTL